MDERAEVREVLGAQIFESVVDAARRDALLRDAEKDIQFEHDAMDAVWVALGGDATDAYVVPDDVVALAATQRRKAEAQALHVHPPVAPPPPLSAALQSLAALLDIVERTGGYMTPEDQERVRIARAVLQRGGAP